MCYSLMHETLGAVSTAIFPFVVDVRASGKMYLLKVKVKFVIYSKIKAWDVIVNHICNFSVVFDFAVILLSEANMSVLRLQLPKVTEYRFQSAMINIIMSQGIKSVRFSLNLEENRVLNLHSLQGQREDSN